MKLKVFSIVHSHLEANASGISVTSFMLGFPWLLQQKLHLSYSYDCVGSFLVISATFEVPFVVTEYA